MILSTLCYVKKNNQTLMLHRIKRESDMHAGKWNGLGGKMQPGETPEECVVREVCEESGLTINAPILRGVITFPAFDDIDDWYVYLFTADEFAGELRESDEGKLAWIDDRKICDLNLWDGDREFFKWLATGKFFSGKIEYTAGRLSGHQVIFYGPVAPPTIKPD